MKLNDVKAKYEQNKARRVKESRREVAESSDMAKYLATDGSGRYFVLTYPLGSGSNPQHLKKMLDKKAQKLGFDHYDVVASWSGNIDDAIAHAEEVAANHADRKDEFPAQYYGELKKAKKLKQAKDIISNNQIEEARDPHDVIRGFLDQKKKRDERGGKLYAERELEKLAQEYQGTMAGMGHRDESDILDDMERIANKYGLNVEDYLEESQTNEAGNTRRMKRDPWVPDTPTPKEFYSKKTGKLVKNQKYWDWIEQEKKKASKVNEADVVDFSSFAGMYHNGAHFAFTDPKTGESYYIYATGDKPRKYYANGKEISWDDLKRLVGRQRVRPIQGKPPVEQNTNGESQVNEIFGFGKKLSKKERHNYYVEGFEDWIKYAYGITKEEPEPPYDPRGSKIEYEKYDAYTDGKRDGALDVYHPDDFEKYFARSKEEADEYRTHMTPEKYHEIHASALGESLPPHLAKFVDPKTGDFTKDAQKRLGKDGKSRLLKKKHKPAKDVTPKGYGPDESIEEDEDPCWDGYRQLGMKKKNGREVPNCVPENEDLDEDRTWANSRAVRGNKAPYNPGVTRLERTITLEPEEIQRVKKALWSVPGIDMKVRGDQVTFKTAKIKTLAKILNKVIDFDATDVGSVLDVPAEIGPLESKVAKSFDEAGNKPVDKQIFGMGDSRTAKELKNQIRNLSDSQLRKWAKDTNKSGSRVKRMQDKLIKSELRRRNMTLVSLDEAEVGDKVKYRNIKSKRNKTGTVRKVSKDKHGGKKYELDGGKIVYDQDLEEFNGAQQTSIQVAYDGETIPVDSESWNQTPPAHQILAWLKTQGRNYWNELSEFELRQVARDLSQRGVAKVDGYTFRINSTPLRPMGEKSAVAEKEGGMSDAERKAYNRKHGSNLKRAQPSGGKRRTSYCARSKGQMDDHNIDCRKTPDKPICKSRRDWNC